MDPVTVIVTALAAGAVAAAKDVATQVVKDAYAGLKSLVVGKFGGQGDVKTAVEQVEKKPDSPARQSVLKEELASAGVAQDADVLRQAQALLELLKQSGHDTATYSAQVIGDGAIAQGAGAAAAGKGGVAVGGGKA
jgi:hypothetical protein